ncbi:MAG: hypothetical protein RJA44_2620, partial [Pseudomonadota bacterium]
RHRQAGSRSLRLIVATFGTKGDTRPMLALCRGLIEAGHEVLLLADRVVQPLAYAHGVPMQALAGDMHGTIATSSALADALRQGGDARHMVQAISQVAAEHTESWLLDLIGAAEGADAILCSGYTGFVGLSAAEYLGIPVIGAGIWPLTPTREFPAVLLPWQVPAALNHVSHRALNSLFWRRFKPHLNQARHAVCAQPPREHMWQDLPIVYGISRHLLPQPADWPDSSRICGAWNLPALDWQPSAALADFLNAGEAPIYVGFGSMSGRQCQRSLGAVLEAIGPRRTLLWPGAGCADPGRLPSHIHVLRDAPHDWLFPRVCMAIHHGASGISHEVCRAGVPSVVLPFANDQFFWAGRLAALGVAAPAQPGLRAQVDTLARLIDHADRSDVQARARQLGALMATEDGLERAVHCIEQWVLRSGRLPLRSRRMALSSAL